MARPARLRANLAAWATGTTVTDAEFDALDQRCFEALTESGGVFALTDDMQVGADSAEVWTFTCETAFTGEANFSTLIADDPTFTGTVTAAAIHADSLTFADYVTGDFIHCDDLNIGNSLIVLAYQDYIYVGAPAWNNGNWDHDDTPGSSKWEQTAQTAILEWHVNVPCFATITEVSVMMLGAGGHGGLTEYKPAIALYSQARATGAVTLIDSEDDPSSSVEEYDAIHPITISGLTEVVSVTNEYIVRLQGESGVNYIAGLKCWGLRIQYTATKVHNSADPP